ncbi:MAG TPA: efflux RND transporter periplasmic adaptor subunit [Gallionella sp.]|nr:MAG: efflux transporter periplasmic adaptor subunit [Gallionellales bacterium GWA2_54_124]OGT20488.1 MAG: efflux transporter periplasmic adaptor subunit [Gallionellales bacterium RIFOXYD12_FULL_53_10]HCI51952.1 efflux RND transporter periplasmic adaptor subunit [Gallionella sp.]
MKLTLLFLVIAASLCACGQKETAAPVNPTRPALTQIVGMHAGEGAVYYSGEIRARNELPVSFRAGGKLIARPVEAGSQVKSGQVLARLDPADAALQAGAARAQYTLAESEALRYRELHRKGFVSQSALDAKEAALQAAVAQSGLTHNQSDYTVLRAGYDGVVSATLAEAGQVVSAGQPVLRLAQSGEIEVAIEIPEADYAARHVGDKADVVLLTAEGEHMNGRLRELSPSADPVSRTYAARVSVAAASTHIPLGMTARVRFEAAKTVAAELLIPVSAVYQQGAHPAVWIVSADHTVSLRPVEISAYRDSGAVITSGLAVGERIVTAGVHRLSAGEKIQLIAPVSVK